MIKFDNIEVYIFWNAKYIICEQIVQRIKMYSKTRYQILIKKWNNWEINYGAILCVYYGFG